MTNTCSRLLLPILVLFAVALRAQDPPLEWGEIPRDQLLMTSFPPDTNAAALVLCDYGETHMNNELHLVFTRHMRIKIFSERAYDKWGAHAITLDESDGVEILDDLEGVTYVLNAEGEIEEHELDDDMIFKEKITGDRYRYRFTFPALAPGCIVEFRYEIESRAIGLVRDWYFQYDEPSLWSEYRLSHPQMIGYAVVTQGNIPLDVAEQQEITQVFTGSAVGYLGTNMTRCYQRRWVLKNGPALRNEPYVLNINDYRVRLDIQLSGYALPGMGVRQILHDWPTVIDEYLDDPLLGKRITPTGRIKTLVTEITAGIASPRDKMKAIYDWVTSNIIWDTEVTTSLDQDMEELLESRRGGSADIGLLLVSMFRAASIQSDPVILSTRSHGAITDAYPLISQFNYLVARATIGSRRYFLDATDPLRPYDLLPEKILDVRGLVLKKGAVEWVTLSSPKRYQVSGIAILDAHSDGSISGSIQCAYREYAALDVRERLTDTPPLDVAKNLIRADALGFTVDSVTISGKDSIDQPLTMVTYISSSEFGQRAGPNVYLNPQVLFRILENPFKSPSRQFPVNYGYGALYDGVVTLNLPNGWTVKEGLGPRGLRLQGNEVSFSRIAETDGGRLQIKTRFERKSSEILASQYPSLRDLFTSLIAAQEEVVVIDQSAVGPGGR